MDLLRKCHLESGLEEEMTSQISIVPGSAYSTFSYLQTHAHTRHSYFTHASWRL